MSKLPRLSSVGWHCKLAKDLLFILCLLFRFLFQFDLCKSSGPSKWRSPLRFGSLNIPFPGSLTLLLAFQFLLKDRTRFLSPLVWLSAKVSAKKISSNISCDKLETRRRERRRRGERSEATRSVVLQMQRLISSPPFSCDTFSFLFASLSFRLLSHSLLTAFSPVICLLLLSIKKKKKKKRRRRSARTSILHLLSKPIRLLFANTKVIGVSLQLFCPPSSTDFDL